MYEYKTKIKCEMNDDNDVKGMINVMIDGYKYM